MLSNSKIKSDFLASSLCDGLEDNNLSQIKILLENNGADPNVLLPVYGVTPFHLAVGNECEAFAEEVTKLFLRYGGDPNVKSIDRMTPVHVAAAYGRVKILELLLVNSGDVSLVDDDGQRPLDYALDGSHHEAVIILEKYQNKNVNDDHDDKSNIKIKLEKILVNKGDIVAEYIFSEENNSEYDETNTALTLNNNIKEEDFNFNESTLQYQVRNNFSKFKDKNTQTKYFHDNLDLKEHSIGHKLLESSVISKSPNCNLNIAPKNLNNQTKKLGQIENIFENSLVKEEKRNKGIEATDFNNLITEDESVILFKDDSALISEDEEGIFSSETINASEFVDAIGHFNYRTNSSECSAQVFKTPLSFISSISEVKSFVSIDEEYAYSDSDKNVAFCERRLRVFPSVEDMNFYVKNESTWLERLAQLSLNSNSEYSVIGNNTLRHRLIAIGDCPGPITTTTYKVYLKKLRKLERNVNLNEGILLSNTRNEGEICKIPKSVITIDWMKNLEPYRILEDKIFEEYGKPNPNKKYRGGIGKVSFNYLLLDPRITKDLPRTGGNLSLRERWEIFLKAIFYIGKGKTTRPVAHLYDAFYIWNGKKTEEPNEKIQRILDIWRNSKGVVCLHVFLNSMQEEAFIREALMIDTLGINHLTNCTRGNYYGAMSSASDDEKRSLGKYLLYKAMKIFMAEGERQLFPKNLE